MAFPLRIQQQIVSDNLHMQERDFSATAEARRSHIADLAHILLAGLPTGHIGAHELAALTADTPILDPALMTSHREALPQNRAYLTHALRALNRADRFTLTGFLQDGLITQNREPALSDFLPQATSDGRIAYVRNNFTDEAFDRFADLLPAPTAFPCEEYDGACHAVAAGEADYCILPVRDSRGATVRTTLNALHTANLTVTACATVCDGEDVPMQYALCGTAILPPVATPELMLTLWEVTPDRLAELCDTVGLFGLCIKALLYGGDATDGTALTVYGAGDYVRLFCWLTLFMPSYHVDGFYEHTQEETE